MIVIIGSAVRASDSARKGTTVRDFTSLHYFRTDSSACCKEPGQIMPQSDVRKYQEAVGIAVQGREQLRKRREDQDAVEDEQNKALNNAGAVRRPLIAVSIDASVSVAEL